LSEFDSILVEAADNALITVVGIPAARAIKFYVDVSLVSRDIDKFRWQLNQFVSGSKLVEDRIIRNLAQSLEADRALAIAPENVGDLKTFVENLRAEFLMK
jgi:hypothetical protein